MVFGWRRHRLRHVGLSQILDLADSRSGFNLWPAGPPPESGPSIARFHSSARLRNTQRFSCCDRAPILAESPGPPSTELPGCLSLSVHPREGSITALFPRGDGVATGAVGVIPSSTSSSTCVPTAPAAGEQHVVAAQASVRKKASRMAPQYAGQ